MHRSILRDESLVEYFKSLVERALENQRVPALDLTGYYLVQLLTAFARSDSRPGGRADEPLALRLGRALESRGTRQREELRTVGDHSLFLAGFFSDSLRRRLVDVDYYASLGGYAYGSLSQADADVLAPAFAELGERFTAFADVLSEVSEASRLTSDTDLLRLYDRWSRLGSRHSGDLLVRQGIVPVSHAGRPLTH